MEDYLESILKMETVNSAVKIKDISTDLEVQMPSVIGALKTLRSRNLVIYEKNSQIELTKAGKTIAISVKERHEAIANFLAKVFLFTAEDAQRTACRIEHVIEPKTAKQFRNLTNYIETEVNLPITEWSLIIKKE